MTEDDLVDATFTREGDVYGDEHTKPRIDQPTGRGGITLDTLIEFVTVTRSPLEPTVATLKALTHAQARDIVRWKLRRISALNGFDDIEFEPLRFQLIDFSYNSGAPRAIRWLQRVLGVEVTGRMDARTVGAVKYPFDAKRVPVWIHQSLLAARLLMIDEATDPGGSVSHDFEEGLENRAFTFNLVKP